MPWYIGADKAMAFSKPQRRVVVPSCIYIYIYCPPKLLKARKVLRAIKCTSPLASTPVFPPKATAQIFPDSRALLRDHISHSESEFSILHTGPVSVRALGSGLN